MTFQMLTTGKRRASGFDRSYALMEHGFTFLESMLIASAMQAQYVMNVRLHAGVQNLYKKALWHL
jgi:hypothetical protein